MSESLGLSNLALHFQEILTAIARVRANREEISDASAFREHIKEELKRAAQQARDRGYAHEDVRLAAFAVIAFLDESILNSRLQVFADWPRKPLQEELFGTHMAGEVFFQNLKRLLERTDAPEVADILEVYCLCLLLGYAGRHSTNRGELQAMIQTTTAKIRRIRGPSALLATAWAPPAEPAPSARDPWARGLAIAAVAAVLLALILFVSFKLSLGSALRNLSAAVSEARI